MTPQRTAALMLVNSFHTQAAGLARGIVTALDDKKITPTEGMMLGMQGMQFALGLLAILKGADAAVRAEVLVVLEEGTLVMPEESP